MPSEMDWASVVNAIEEPVLIIDSQYVVQQVNDAFCKRYGVARQEAMGKPCYELTHRFRTPCCEQGIDCPLKLALEEKERRRVIHQHAVGDGKTIWEEIIATPVADAQGELTWVVEELRDVTELLATREVVGSLKEHLKVLEGLLPICASCKKIRKPDGAWKTLEAYLTAHSEAELTHGLCPDCVAALYPELGKRSHAE